MPARTRFCPACGNPRAGKKPFCKGCGHRFDEPADSPGVAQKIAGAAQQVASAASAAQSAVSSAASAVQGAGQLAALVLDGTPPPVWHVVVGETLPSVEEILARQVVRAAEQQAQAIGRQVVDRAARRLDQAIAGQAGGSDAAPAEPEPESPHFCERCGAAMDVQSRFCLSCGQPHRHEPTPGPARGPAPGTANACPRCRAPVSPGWQFCKKCGLHLNPQLNRS